MNSQILNYLSKHFTFKNIKVVERLLGGMSNYTYIVSCDDELYTFRIPGEYSEVFVNNVEEQKNISLMEKLGITNQTIYLNTDDGVKLSKYVEGISLNHINDYPFDKISVALHKIHDSGYTSENDYCPFARLNHYEEALYEKCDFDKLHHQEALIYQQCRKELEQYREYLESQPKKICHGDSQPSNFILTKDGVCVVDFEFAGNNDPIYDIACFANIKLSDGEALLNEYFKTPSIDEKKRFYLWRAFQCMQWFNVAYFKEVVGLSEKLHFDFAAVAVHYLELSKQLLTKVRTEFV